jgi:hypothetical protein
MRLYVCERGGDLFASLFRPTDRFVLLDQPLSFSQRGFRGRDGLPKCVETGLLRCNPRLPPGDRGCGLLASDLAGLKLLGEHPLGRFVLHSGRIEGLASVDGSGRPHRDVPLGFGLRRLRFLPHLLSGFCALLVFRPHFSDGLPSDDVEALCRKLVEFTVLVAIVFLGFRDGGLRGFERRPLPFEIGLQARDFLAHCLHSLLAFAPLVNETAANLCECCAAMRDFLPPAGEHRREYHVEPGAHGGEMLFHALKHSAKCCHFGGLGILLGCELPDFFARDCEVSANDLAFRGELSRCSLCVRGPLEGFLGLTEDLVQHLPKRADGSSSFSRGGIVGKPRDSDVQLTAGVQHCRN